MIRRLRSWACLAVIGTLLAGCSYVYNYHLAELWLRWYVDDYVQWDRTQEQLFRQRLREQLQWHRSTQLQQYCAWLAELRSDAAGELSIDLLERRGVQLRDFWSAITAQVEPDFLHFLSGLSVSQARDLIANFRDEQAKRREEYGELTTAELSRERSRDMIKNIQRWTGRLDAAQRERVERWAAALPDSREPWLASRAHWIDALERALAQRDEPEVFASEIHTLFVTPQQLWEPAYRKLLEDNTGLTLVLLVDIHNSLSLRQRGALDRHLEQWIHTLDELAGDAGKSGVAAAAPVRG